MSIHLTRLWIDGTLVAAGTAPGASGPPELLAADSWRVETGKTLALDLHRQRFSAAVLHRSPPVNGAIGPVELAAFWEASLAQIPADGDWFPRVELVSAAGDPTLQFHLRSTPELSRSVRAATYAGADPRPEPTIKGPGTAALLAARADVARQGAEEAILVSPDGFVIEGAYSALLWWRGDYLCAPSLDLPRVDSVTARSVIALATALGIDIHYESVSPGELDGCEIWALSALQGIRIVTAWIAGPAPAELPGRLALWRARLDRLRRVAEKV